VTGTHDATLAQFEQALVDADQPFYELTLFVSGASDLSGRAVANARRLCEQHLEGRYHLSVVDVHDDPSKVGTWLLAVPTLVKHLPLPVRKLVGDLSNVDKVMVALQLTPAVDPPHASG
jgi:circadian clock protein KaiB